MTLEHAVKHLEQKEQFIKAAAEFLGGANQVRMSVGLQVGQGQLHEVAQIWLKMREAIPGIFGYPTVEEVENTLREFLA